jgi:hypothetical protein
MLPGQVKPALHEMGSQWPLAAHCVPAAHDAVVHLGTHSRLNRQLVISHTRSTQSVSASQAIWLQANGE